jgi:hypothetical protein
LQSENSDGQLPNKTPEKKKEYKRPQKCKNMALIVISDDDNEDQRSKYKPKKKQTKVFSTRRYKSSSSSSYASKAKNKDGI